MKISQRRYQIKRDARIEINGGHYSRDEWDKLCEIFDHRCVKCGNNAKLSADHIVPVAKGGGSNISNIQPLCRKCNSIKGHREETDYRISFNERFGFYDVDRRWMMRVNYLYSLFFNTYDFSRNPKKFIELLNIWKLPSQTISFAEGYFK